MAKAAKVQTLTPFRQLCNGMAVCLNAFFDSGWEKSKVPPELLQSMNHAAEVGSIHLFDGVDKQLLIYIATASDYATQSVENLQKLCLNQDNLTSYNEFIVNLIESEYILSILIE